MRINMLMIVLLGGLVQLQAKSVAQTVTINARQVKFEDVFKEIKKQTGYNFLYNKKIAALNKPISITAKNKPLKTFLDECFAGRSLEYTIDQNTILIRESTAKEIAKRNAGLEQQKTIRGKVTDERKAPVPGVSIRIKGSTEGTMSNTTGEYAINYSGANDVIIFSMIGYKTIELPVAGKTEINVTLLEDTQLMQEVVVTALGIKRDEKALGYAVQNVSTKGLTEAKTVDVGTKLTGKVAGLNVKNSTEFNAAPVLELRGGAAMLVVDGVPFDNLSLRDIAPDDIESISVLKGATASALYGSKGGNGAIMIQTKRGLKGGGLDVTVNSSSMFTSGFLSMPDVQTSYSSGSAGKYRIGDYVWGDKLDIGRTANMYDPFTYEWKQTELVSKGKKNLSNFLESSYILNNNVSISQQGENGGIRSSFTHVKNKGQYPNTMLNKFTAALAGNMRSGNFDMDAGITYNKRYYPNNVGTGYGASGYLYNLIVWSGTEYDVRDYKNYWVRGKEDSEQNWMDKVWYNNPYFIANEMLTGSDYDFSNAFVTANYKIKPWLKATFRSGIDYFAQKMESRNPIGTVGVVKGSYSKSNNSGYSLNNDFILQGNHKWGNFGIDVLAGGTIFYEKDNSTTVSTQNGLSVPGFYSIYASVDPVSAAQSQSQRQVNSLYGKATLSWKSELFVDVTGRNEWNSTLNRDERSYFYPSVAASWVVSETFALPKVIDLFKLRGSWTETKFAPGVYEINTTYGLSINSWNNMTGASYPTTIRSKGIRPQSLRSYEAGFAAAMLKSRLKLDVAYYNNLSYDNIRAAGVSGTSGFNSTYINIEEQTVRKGLEITLSGTIIQEKDWSWESTLNWSQSRIYYDKLDPVFSTDQPWVQKGNRWDWISVYDYDRAPDGSIIHSGGYPVISKFASLLGYSSPDYIVGLTNTVQWKNLSLSFTIDGRVGGMMFNTMNQALWNSGTHIDSDNSYRYDQVVNGLNNYVGQGSVVVSGTVQRDTYGNIIPGTDTRVFGPNTREVSYESYMKNNNPYIGTQRIQNFYDQTFFKLRDLTISYNIPAKVSKKLGMKNAAVSLIGQNLLLWTKDFRFSDPDVGSDNLNSPSIRYIGGSLKFSF